MRRAAVRAGAVAVALALASCAGDDGKSAALSASADDRATTSAASTATPTRTPAAEESAREPTPGARPARNSTRRAASRPRSRPGRATPRARDKRTVKRRPRPRLTERAQKRRQTPAASPDARFIAMADGACARYREREAAARRENDGSKPQQIRYLNTVAQLLDEIVRDIRALGAPPRDADAVTKYLSTVERLSGEVRELRDVTERPDSTYASKATRVSQTSAEAKSVARAYGFHVCGSD